MSAAPPNQLENSIVVLIDIRPKTAGIGGQQSSDFRRKQLFLPLE